MGQVGLVGLPSSDNPGPSGCWIRTSTACSGGWLSDLSNWNPSGCSARTTGSFWLLDPDIHRLQRGLVVRFEQPDPQWLLSTDNPGP